MAKNAASPCADQIARVLVGVLAFVFLFEAHCLLRSPTTLTMTAPCAAQSPIHGAQTAQTTATCTTTTQAHNEATVRMLFGISAGLCLAALLGARLTSVTLPGVELRANPPLTVPLVQQALGDLIEAGTAGHEAVSSTPDATFTTTLNGRSIALYDDLTNVPVEIIQAWKEKLPAGSRPMDEFRFAARRNDPGEHLWWIVTKYGTRWKVVREGSTYTATLLPTQA